MFKRRAGQFTGAFHHFGCWPLTMDENTGLKVIPAQETIHKTGNYGVLRTEISVSTEWSIISCLLYPGRGIVI